MNIFDLHYAIHLNVLKVENPLKYIADAIIENKQISVSLNVGGDDTFTTNISKEYILKETEIGEKLVKGCQRFQDNHDVELFTICGEIVSKEYANALIEAVLY